MAYIVYSADGSVHSTYISLSDEDMAYVEKTVGSKLEILSRTELVTKENKAREKEKEDRKKEQESSDNKNKDE